MNTKTRSDLQNDIKAAKAAKKTSLDARRVALKAIRAARAAYKDATVALATAKGALKDFDAGKRPE